MRSQQQTTPGDAELRTRIQKQIERVPLATDRAVQLLNVDGANYVIKYRRHEPGLRWRASVSAVACFLLFGVFPSPSRLRPGDIHHEARRLLRLYEQGVSVPRVCLLTDRYLVTEHCGTSINKVLYTLDPTEHEQLFKKLVDDLAQFHRAGHWHGGAQIRNITRKDNVLYRIDFEENTGNALPLDLAQTYDVVLLFTSLADHVAGHGTLGPQLLARYLDGVESVAILRRLTKLERWLAFLMRAEPLLTRRLREKSDVRRARTFVAILKNGLATAKQQ